MNFKSYQDLSEDIKSNLFRIQNSNYDLVVGIPRSGIIPSSMIALLLNVQHASLNDLINDNKLLSTSTRGHKVGIDRPSEASRILLVDDSLHSGKSIKKVLSMIPANLRSRIRTLVVYSSGNKEDVDIIFDYLKMPRIFEWNIFHHKILQESCVDIDGVLCIDPTPEENDDGENYLKFLREAKPNILPTGIIHTLISNRLEKYRSPTEEWLLNNGIQYQNLILLDLPSKQARIEAACHSSHKANYYMNTKLNLFIESDIRQATEISRLSGRSVYCTDEGVMITPDLLYTMKKDPKHFIRDRLRSLKKFVRRQGSRYLGKYIGRRARSNRAR